MKAFSLVLVAFVSLILLLSFGCAQQRPPAVNETQPPGNQTGNGTVVPPQMQPCSEGNVLQKDECFHSLAVSRNDPQICQNIYSIEKIDSCYAVFANSSLEICQRISDSATKRGCLYANALALKSEGICRLIENDTVRADCLQKTVPPCMLILDEGERSLCLALEKSDYTLCVGDDCLAQYARQRNDPAPCGAIKSEPARYACAAIVSNDVNVCKQAAFASIQDACIQEASIELGKPEGCLLATPGSSYANICHLHFAVEYNDAAYCKKPYQEEQRDDCYTSFANLTANATACEKVINRLNKIGCYRIAAIGNRMPSMCNDIGSASNARDCYAASILYVDAGPVPSDCPNVAEQDWRNKCYLRSAIKQNDGSYCQFITEGPDKTDCTELFGN